MCRLFLTDHKYDLSERIEIAFERIKINRRMTEVAVDQTIYFSGCRLGTGLLGCDEDDLYIVRNRLFFCFLIILVFL